MRTVLSVDRIGVVDPMTGAEMMVVKAVRSPFNVAGANVARAFKLAPGDLPDWSSPNGVRLRGQLIRARLDGHGEIRQLLAHLEQTQVGEVSPLYVALQHGDAELINWETLCSARGDFVALDRRWPIGRITDPMSGQMRPPATLRLPVKILAVVSALGIQGQGKEWTLFREALERARAAGLPIRMKLLVGDPALRQEVENAIAAGLADVEVSHIDKTPSRVLQEILAWSPHVVHFFCHGEVDARGQSLQIATASDYGNGQGGTGSVRIRIEDLVSMSVALSNPWLLTLNCCSSGQAASDLHSMAHQVVSAGFPAAIAMLEPVDASDAHEFTRAFYAAVFANLERARQTLARDTRAPFEWADALYDARTAIRDLHQGNPESRREWALPVLYVRGLEPFHFERPHEAFSEDDAKDYKLKARLVAEWLQGVREDTSEAKRIAVMEKTLADVPREFWPTVEGTFGAE